jgi:hypothetical protein
MERGPKFERGFLNGGKKEEESKKAEIEIISVEAKESKLEKGPPDRILTPEEIEEKIKREKEIAREITRFKESEVGGLVPSSIVIAYPSGLILEFKPCFYGKPHIETFAGYYSCHLVVPGEYDPEGKLEMNNEAIRKRLIAGRKMTLEPKIFERTLSEQAKEKTPLKQAVGFVLADEFAVGYYHPLKLWVVLLDRKALQRSEKNVFPIFHELGHIPYSSIEDQLIGEALREEQKKDKRSEEDYEFIKGASRFISVLREDLQKLKPELRSQIIEALKYTPCDPIKQKYIEGISQIARGVLLKQKEEAVKAGDNATAEVIQRILNAILVFSERMATARAAALSRRLRSKGVTLSFVSSDDLINFYREALESYSETYSDPRFLKGFRNV